MNIHRALKVILQNLLFILQKSPRPSCQPLLEVCVAHMLQWASAAGIFRAARPSHVCVGQGAVLTSCLQKAPVMQCSAGSGQKGILCGEEWHCAVKHKDFDLVTSSEWVNVCAAIRTQPLGQPRGKFCCHGVAATFAASLRHAWRVILFCTCCAYRCKLKWICHQLWRLKVVCLFNSCVWYSEALV